MRLISNFFKILFSTHKKNDYMPVDVYELDVDITLNEL